MRAPFRIKKTIAVKYRRSQQRFVNQKSAWATGHVSGKLISFIKTSSSETVFALHGKVSELLSSRPSKSADKKNRRIFFKDAYQKKTRSLKMHFLQMRLQLLRRIDWQQKFAKTLNN